MREKQLCLKNYLHQPFKTENTCFSWVSFSQSYSKKMPLKHKNFRVAFTRKAVVRQSQKFLSKIWCFHSLPNPFSRDELTHELLAKMPLNEFLMKNMKNSI